MRKAPWILVALALVPAPAIAGTVATGCCLREFLSDDPLSRFICTNTTAVDCFTFAGVGVIREGFEAGKICASDGRSCVDPPVTGIEVRLGLDRPPADPDLPGPILVYPSFASGEPVDVRLRVVNHTAVDLTHVTVRIFVGEEELLDDENVAFTSAPGAGFLLGEPTTLPPDRWLVGALVCYADGPMSDGACPEYPTGVNGDELRGGGGQNGQVQVFSAQVFGAFLPAGEVSPAPALDVAAAALLCALLLLVESRRRRMRLSQAEEREEQG